MELADILELILILIIFLLFLYWFRSRHQEDRSEGEPYLSEQVQLRLKSEAGRFRCIKPVLYLHFYIPERNITIVCKAPQNVWEQFQKGDQGILSHQGGTFFSFIRDFDGKIISLYSART